jgi:hypothetical protein
VNAQMPRNKLPQVNLFARPRRAGGRPRPRRLIEASLIVAMVVIWGIVGVSLAILLGVGPHLSLGP